MYSRFVTMLAAALFVLSFASLSEAQIFGRAGAYRSVQFRVAPYGYYHGPRRAPTYPEYYDYMNSWFPKYYGGFHASYFQSTGISPGDYGLRGNGIFAVPW